MKSKEESKGAGFLLVTFNKSFCGVLTVKCSPQMAEIVFNLSLCREGC